MKDTIPEGEVDDFLEDGWTFGAAVGVSSLGSSSRSSTSRSSPSGMLNSMARVFLSGGSTAPGSSSSRVGTAGLVVSSPSGWMETVGGGGSLLRTSGRSAISNPDDVSYNEIGWNGMQ